MENKFLGREGDTYVLYEVDEDGNIIGSTRLETADAIAEALAYLSDRYLSDGSIPVLDLDKDGKIVVAGQLSAEEFYNQILLPLSARIAETAGSEEQAIALTRAALTHPRVLALLSQHNDPKDLRRIWPELDEILDGALSVSGEGDNVGEIVPPGAPPDKDPGPDDPATGSGLGPVGPPGDAMRDGDPILASAGELIIEETDLLLPGVGLDIEFARTYRHRSRYDGPLGRNWDHSYNLRLDEAVEYGPGGALLLVVYRSVGEARRDRFVMAEANLPIERNHGLVLDAAFLPPSGGREMLVKRGGQYWLIAPDGREIVYDEQLRAGEIRDRNGNRVRLFYGELGLETILDTCEREIRLEYDEEGRLCGLRDLTNGRSIRYGYDDSGRFAEVARSTGRPEMPEVRRRYQYLGDDAAPEMADNIVEVIDAEGVVALCVQYGMEPGTPGFNTVLAQDEYDAGWRYEYETIFPVEADPAIESQNIARLRVRIEAPNGALHENDYNDMGRLVAQRVRSARLGPSESIEFRFAYDPDGRLVREERPEGAIVTYLYRREAWADLNGDPDQAPPAERLRFGELLRVVEHARPTGDTPPLRITEFEYDIPALVTRRRGPYYADLNGEPLPGEVPFDLRLGYDANGNLRSIDYPDATLADGTMQAGRRMTFDVDGRGRQIERRLVVPGGEDIVTRFVYDLQPQHAAFVIEEIADPGGLAETTYRQWSAAGHLLVQTEAGEHSVRRRYDHLGLVLHEERSPHVAGGSSGTTTLRYDTRGAVRESRTLRVAADGRPDTAGSLVEEMRYDAAGHLIEVRERSGDGLLERTTTFAYDAAGRRIAFIDPRGLQTRHSYNIRDLPEAVVEAVDTAHEARHRYRYNAEGQLTELMDPEEQVRRLRYDGFGRVSRVDEPNGTILEQQWDAQDSLVRRVVRGRHPDAGAQARLAESRREYDEAGRLRRTIEQLFDPAGGMEAPAVTQYLYDHADRLVAVIDPEGRRQNHAYDVLGRGTRFDDAVGNVTSWQYNSAQRQTVQRVQAAGTTPAGAAVVEVYETTSVFDPYGNLVEMRDALGNSRRFGWTSDGLNVLTIDEAGATGRRRFGAFGQLAALTLAEGSAEELSLRYDRDWAGDLVRFNGPSGVLLAIERDRLGRPRQVRYGPAGVFASMLRRSYDTLGRVTSLTDGNGLVARLDYGADGGPLRETYDRAGVVAPAGQPWFLVGGPAAVAYGYDGLGRMVRAEDGNHVVEWRYDSRGQVISERVDGRAFRYGYDRSGRLVSILFPDGRTIAHSYDAAGRLIRIEQTAAGIGHPGDAGVVDVVETWPLGHRGYIARRLGGRVLATTRRDGAGRLVALEYTRIADGTLISRLGRVFDRRGLVAALQWGDANGATSVAFEADAQGRLRRQTRSATPALRSAADLAGPAPPLGTQAELDALAAQIALEIAADPARRTMEVELAPDGQRRRMRTAVGAAPPAERVYQVDPAGRYSTVDGVVRSYDGNGNAILVGQRRHQYDQANRLVAIEEGVNLLALTRDPLGRVLTSTTAAGVSNLSHFAFGGLAEVRDGGGNLAAQHLHGGAPGDLVQIAAGADSHAVLTDFSGSPAASVGAAGLTGPWNFGSFGEGPDATGPGVGLGIGFHGLWRATPGLPYMTDARAYDPDSGSFLQPDPLGYIDGPFRYAYGLGNPQVWSDPTGLAAATPRPQGNLPQHTTDFLFNGVRTKEDLAWYERALAAMGGAVHSIVNMFVETGKQIYDLAGTGFGALGTWLDLWDYQHETVSGIGRLAASGKGTLDIFAEMGRGIVETPGRMLAAAERGDYVGFGAEAMNTYLLGRAAVGIARGSLSVAGNNAVKAMGHLGPRGQKLYLAVRQAQVNRLRARTARIMAERGQELPENFSWHFGREGPPGVSGVTNTGGVPAPNAPTGYWVTIYERAFTPGFGASLPSLNPANPYFALRPLGILRAVKGDQALGTGLHEGWHSYQFATNRVHYNLAGNRSYFRNPTEFTMSRSQPYIGAHNFEWQTVAPSPFRAGVYLGVGVGSETSSRADTDARTP